MRADALARRQDLLARDPAPPELPIDHRGTGRVEGVGASGAIHAPRTRRGRELPRTRLPKPVLRCLQQTVDARPRGGGFGLPVRPFERVWAVIGPKCCSAGTMTGPKLDLSARAVLLNPLLGLFVELSATAHDGPNGRAAFSAGTRGEAIYPLGDGAGDALSFGVADGFGVWRTAWPRPSARATRTRPRDGLAAAGARPATPSAPS